MQHPLQAAVLAFCAVSLPGQGKPLAAPAQLLEGLRLEAGTVQDLLLPLRSDSPFRVDVVLGERTCTLDLRPHDVRARDFRLLVDNGHGMRRLPTPPSVTFRGTVAGDGAPVAASLVAGSLSATIHFDGQTWGIQPASDAMPGLPASTHIVYRAADVRRAEVSCGTGPAAPLPDVPGTPGPQALKIAELAIDADFEYYQRNGSDTTNVNNAVTTVINGINVIYQRDVEIDHRLTAIVVRTAQLYTWTGDLCRLHDDFASHWSVNHRNIQRDVAHLFTGKGTFDGVVGCSSSAAICTPSAYGVSKVYAGLTTNIGLVAHEMGHLWGSGHCNATTPCNIMCASLGGCSGDLAHFGPYAINAISAHRNSRPCLDDPPPTNPPVITNIAPNTTTSWQPGRITLTGTDLGQVNAVTIGGIAATINSKAATSLTFTPPSPFAIANHTVVASNVVGPSNPVNLTITGNHPAVLSLSLFWVRGGTATIELHSDTNWQAALFVSPSNNPSSAPGIVDFGIGANFTSLIFFANVFPAADGAAMQTILVPLGIPSGTTLYWQAAAMPSVNPTLPIETSNVASRVVF